jgi:hypothetical protein
MNSSGFARKLGIKPGMTVLLRDAPSGFASLLSNLADGIKLLRAVDDKADCVIAFVRCKADVQAVASPYSARSWKTVCCGLHIQKSRVP